ncbi:MAG: CPBP family intramembrane glutamic endopeptidase [Candidatus Acidiferrales bacterium]
MFGARPASATSSILFGFGHNYLGARQVGTSATGGVLFAAVVWVAGPLLPAMMLHAALDLNSFDLGYRALSKTGNAGAGPTVQALS